MSACSIVWAIMELEALKESISYLYDVLLMVTACTHYQPIYSIQSIGTNEIVTNKDFPYKNKRNLGSLNFVIQRSY
jgi:hypothetical protein